MLLTSVNIGKDGIKKYEIRYLNRLVPDEIFDEIKFESR